MCYDSIFPGLVIQPTTPPGVSPTKIVGVFIDRHQLSMPEFHVIWDWIIGTTVPGTGGNHTVKYAFNRIYLDTLSYSTLPFTHAKNTFPPLAETDSVWKNWKKVKDYAQANKIQLHAWIKTFYAGMPLAFEEKNKFLMQHKDWHLMNGKSNPLFKDPDTIAGSEWFDPSKYIQFIETFKTMVLAIKEQGYFSSIDLDFIRYPKPPNNLNYTSIMEQHILGFVEEIVRECKRDKINPINLGIINHPYNVAALNMQEPLVNSSKYTIPLNMPNGFYTMCYSHTFDEFKGWFTNYMGKIKPKNSGLTKPTIEFVPVNYPRVDDEIISMSELVPSIQLGLEKADGCSVFLPTHDIQILGKVISNFRNGVDIALKNLSEKPNS